MAVFRNALLGLGALLLCAQLSAQDAGPTATDTGSIVVHAAATALVYVDDESAGLVLTNNVLHISGVAVGPHTVRLQYGDNSESQQVTVTAGEEKSLNFVYVPKSFGRAVFRGFPDGSVVKANDVELGTVSGGPLNLTNLLTGFYTFQVKHPLWLTAVILSAQVDDGKTATLDFSGARLVVDVVPAGTVITVNGVGVAQTTKDEKNLVLGSFPTGSYVVHAAAIDDERSVDANTTVVAGKDVKLALVLPAKKPVEVAKPVVVEPATKPTTTPTTPAATTPAATATPTTTPAATTATTAVAPAPAASAKATLTLAIHADNATYTVTATRLSDAGLAQLKNDAGRPQLSATEAADTANFVGAPLTLAQGDQTLDAGEYWISVKDAANPVDFGSYLRLDAGDKKTFTLPDQDAYQLAVAQADLERVNAKIKKRDADRAVLGVFNVSLGITAAAALGVTTFGLVDMGVNYASYTAASDTATASQLHSTLNTDMNLFVFGGSASAATALGFFLTLVDTRPDALDREHDALMQKIATLKAAAGQK